MTVMGYARVSTTDQDLSIKETNLPGAGCDVIRAEKRSGTTTQGRGLYATVYPENGKGAGPTGMGLEQRTTMPPGEPRVALICLRLTSRNALRE
jgi:hypothetical protein